MECETGVLVAGGGNESILTLPRMGIFSGRSKNVKMGLQHWTREHNPGKGEGAVRKRKQWEVF